MKDEKRGKGSEEGKEHVKNLNGGSDFLEQIPRTFAFCKREANYLPLQKLPQKKIKFAPFEIIVRPGI